jgi:hypothetical protein
MLNQIISKVIREATGDGGGGRGAFIPPIQPGLRPWSGESLQPFTQAVSNYKNPLVQYDSYDHTWDLRTKQIIELEKTAAKIQDFIKRNPFSTFSDEEGNIINRYFENSKQASFKEKMDPYIERVPFNEWVELTHKDVITETSSSVTSGPYNAPIEIGHYNWSDSELSPFNIKVETDFNKKSLKNTLNKNIKRVVGVWEKDKNGSYERDVDYPETINEDLAVWFGTKKKPKGSKQPKGPWVNICRKVDGKHPPCGRPDTSKGGYPKCRAAGVAGKMSDSAKKSACSQKRSAEKKDAQTGKGQKPVMTSYKPKNESVDQIIGKVLLEIRNSI